MALLARAFYRLDFAAFITPTEADQYIAGCIILAAAPCTAMVFVWRHLTNGDLAYTLAVVAEARPIGPHATFPNKGSDRENQVEPILSALNEPKNKRGQSSRQMLENYRGKTWTGSEQLGGDFVSSEFAFEYLNNAPVLSPVQAKSGYRYY